MTRPPRKFEFEKFRRYHESRKAKRQTRFLLGAQEEVDALSFIEKHLDVSGWTA